MSSDLPLTRSAWKDRLATLPGSPNHIPAFFFGHGSPLLALSKAVTVQNPLMHVMIERSGLESPFADFLRDFGPALLAKYKPKGILVFSAHWETEGEQLGALTRRSSTWARRPTRQSHLCFCSFFEHNSDRLWGRKPPAHGLLRHVSGVIQAPV